LTHTGLLRIRMDSEGATYLPRLDDGLHTRDLSFEEWWNEIVFKDKDGETFSRKELVITAANQDGGGHVDPDLDEVYDRIVRENSIGWIIQNGNEQKPMADPTKPAIRQIAHELLKTLSKIT
jgi:hypothetical protein